MVRGKHERRTAHAGAIRQRALALVMVLVLLCAFLPSTVLTSAADAPCEHEHNASCGYIESSPCTDVHTHDALCGYAEATPEVPCSCTETDENNETLHSDGCGYLPATEGSPCTYTHIHDDACGYSEGSPCTHICGDGSCAYVEPTPEPVCSCDPQPSEDGAHTDPKCPLYSPPICMLGYISADETPLYAEAGTESEILTQLAKNTEVIILSETEAWLNITCEVNGKTFTGYVAAAQVLDAQIDKTLPLLPNYALDPVTAEDGSVISITGLLPENAYVTVKLVKLTDAMALVGAQSEAEILFAYDIKIMLPAEDEGGKPTEYQPTVPVNVSITPPAPIEVPVEVTHIDDKENATAVSDVTTTENGAVKFEVEGFSIYIGTAGSYSPYTGGTVYWYGAGFYTDPTYTSLAYEDTSGNTFDTLADLIKAVEYDTTIYMDVPTSPSYTVSGTEDWSSAHQITIMRRQGARMLEVASTGKLTIGSGITIDGGGEGVNTPSTGIAVLAAGATKGELIIDDGATIQNFIVQSNGAALFVNGGILTMNGGSISLNHASQTGGAILLRNSAAFTMTGGTISGNSATGVGGGVCIESSSVMNVSGGTITGNVSADSADISNSATMIFSGGSVGAISGTPPINADGATLRLYTIDTGLASGASVTGLTVKDSDGVDYPYSNDMVADASGRIYLWLPQGCTVQMNGVAVASIPTASISYNSLVQGTSVLNAVLTDVVPTGYQWQINNGTADAPQWSDIENATLASYTPGLSDIGKQLRVVITGNGNEYTSSFINIKPPSFSVTVPIEMDVTIEAGGNMNVSSGVITNYSSKAVCVTSVKYAWKTDGVENSTVAGGVFQNYLLVIPKLTLGSGASAVDYTFGGAIETTRDTTANGRINAVIGQTPGTLTLPWSFTLGEGNYIKLAMAAGDEVQIATITYTVEIAAA